MSKRDKLRQKLRNNPRNIKFSELETLLIRFGFVRVRVTGSHHIFVFSNENGSIRIIIPVHGNLVKPEYVQDVVEKLDVLFPKTEPSGDEGEDE